MRAKEEACEQAKKFVVTQAQPDVGQLIEKVVPAFSGAMEAEAAANPDVVKHRYVLDLATNSLTKVDK